VSAGARAAPQRVLCALDKQPPVRADAWMGAWRRGGTSGHEQGGEPPGNCRALPATHQASAGALDVAVKLIAKPPLAARRLREGERWHRSKQKQKQRGQRAVRHEQQGHQHGCRQHAEGEMAMRQAVSSTQACWRLTRRSPQVGMLT
jgi:hypothetical protein